MTDPVRRILGRWWQGASAWANVNARETGDAGQADAVQPRDEDGPDAGYMREITISRSRDHQALYGRT